MGNECEGEAELELEFLLSDRSTWGQHSTVPKYSMYSSLQVTVPDRRYIPVVAATRLCVISMAVWMPVEGNWNNEVPPTS